ncbi:hypothetical protein Tco_0799682 [Tanacetum coccineum]|uniref:Reverse transcriptase Ty1/copia-type domain-containing protein n=1 Tax=Tanacetum coccineum TaxID=301880 RepID=A0ABQ4ZQZ9_9ASTR
MGSKEVSNFVPEVNTATPKDLVGPSHASEATQVEDQEVEMGNIPQSYAVPTTPHIRIHKDHPIEHAIGEVQSSVQIRRMTTSYSEQGFLSSNNMKGTDSSDLHKCPFLLFPLSRRTKKSSISLLLYPAWVEAMQEELLQFKLQKVWILVDLPKGHKAIGPTEKKAIFFIQDNMSNEILRKYNYIDVKSASTPIDLENLWFNIGDALMLYEHLYRSMIGSLMYLIASRPDIMFAVCACARFQVSPKTSHLLAVKRIFRYLKGKPSLGLWYSKDSPLELVAYTDSDYAGSYSDRKLTIGVFTMSYRHQELTSPEQTATGKDFSNPLIVDSLLKTITDEASTDTDGEVTITAIIDGQSKTITEASLRRHLKLEDHDDMQKKQLKTHSITYPVPSLNNKVFSNMRRLTKGYIGVEIRLFPTMLTLPTPSSSPTRITSSPSLSSAPSTEPTFEPQPSPDAESMFPTPMKSPLSCCLLHMACDEVSVTKQTYSALSTKLILRIKSWSLKSRWESNTAGRVVYGRRSKKARKDKGKAIMTEPKPRIKKASSNRRDEEIARQLLALDEERVTTETKTTKDIDWNDPSVQRYWDMKNKPIVRSSSKEEQDCQHGRIKVNYEEERL